jgi:hypothetical protein
MSIIKDAITGCLDISLSIFGRPVADGYSKTIFSNKALLEENDLELPLSLEGD